MIINEHLIDIIKYSPYYYNIVNCTNSTAESPEMLTDDAIIKYKYDILDRRLPIEKIKHLYRNTPIKGQPELTIFWSFDDIQRQMRVIAKKRKEYYGISFFDKCCMSHMPGETNNPNKFMDRVIWLNNGRALSFSSEIKNDSELQEYYYWMCKFKPTWLDMESNFVARLFVFLRTNCLAFPDSIKYIEVRTSYLSLKNENLDLSICEHDSIKIAHLISTDIIPATLFEIAPNNYNILEELVCVEKFDGKIYISSKINHAFPIIRYPLSSSETFINLTLGEEFIRAC